MRPNPKQAPHVTEARAQRSFGSGGKYSQLDFNPERLLAGYNLAGGRNPGQDLGAARARYLEARERERQEEGPGKLSVERTKI
eukprot:1211670-Rhodomonas_salina.1